MDPATGRRADALLHDVDERGDVVVGDLLAFVHGGDVEPGPLAHGRASLGGDDAELGPRLDREHLDLEPRAEPRVVGEQVGDLGRGVAGDHARAGGESCKRLGGDVATVVEPGPRDAAPPPRTPRSRAAATSGPVAETVHDPTAVGHDRVTLGPGARRGTAATSGQRGGGVEPGDDVAGARARPDSPRSRATRRRTRRRASSPASRCFPTAASKQCA